MSVQTPDVPAAARACPSPLCAGRRFALLLAVAGVLYGPFLGIPHFGDDYLYLFEDPWSAVWRYFVTYHDLGGIFRPLQMAWCALNQALFGERTVVLQAGQVALHAGLALVLWQFLDRRGLPQAAAAGAALLFVAHPISVSAVLGNDTGSQLAAALLGFAAAARAWEYAAAGTAGGATAASVATDDGTATARLRPGAAVPPGVPLGRAAAEREAAAAALRPAVRGWPVVALVALALLAKESALSYAVLVVFVLVYGAWRRRDGGAGAVRGAVLLALACVLVTALYFAYRGQMAPTRIAWSPTDAYGFHLGLNVLRNQAFLFGGALLPASTSDVLAAVAQRRIAVLAGAGVLTALWCGLLATGLWRARRPGASAGLLLAASLTTFPMTLMNHVSELYVYNLLPLLSVLVGLALSPVLAPGEPAAVLLPRQDAAPTTGPAAEWPRLPAASSATRAAAGAAAPPAFDAGSARGGPPALADLGSPARRTPVAALAILFLVTVSSALAVQRKAAEMRANGRATEQLAAAVVDVARAAPPGATITLWERPHPGRAYYSVFRTTDFQGLLVAERWLRHRAGRADVTIRVLPASAEPPADAQVYVRVAADGRAALRPLRFKP